MQYRPEIDGLRALAVTSVVLAHAGLPAVSGGFIGVDIFFAISGYLITSILLSDYEKGLFSFREFYYRRARRILPALFVVLAATLVVGWIILTPLHFADLGKSTAAAALFLANVHYWESTGYFETSAEFLPLLHTWSLAVEEQYYLVFPLLFLLLIRRSKLLLFLGILVLGCLSLVLAEWGARNLPEANFFFTFSRFWEIFAGAFCAVLVSVRQTQGNVLLAGAGLVLMLCCIFLFTPETPTPSLLTAVPLLGACLFLTYARSDVGAGRLFSNRGLTFLGAMSYSTYLWHQPVFAFARVHGYGHVAPEVMAALVLLVHFLAYLSWRFVEQPFRQAHKISRRQVFRLSLGGIAAVTAIGLLLSQSKLNHWRYSAKDLALIEYAERYRVNSRATEVGKYVEACILSGKHEAPNLNACMFPDGFDGTLVIGDSHAQSLASGAYWAESSPGLISAAGCPPIFVPSVAKDDWCQAHNARLFEVLTDPSTLRPRTLILHANWRRASIGKDARFDTVEALAEALERSVRRLNETLPDTKIIVVGGVPQWNVDLPIDIYRRNMSLDHEYVLPNDNVPKIAEINTELAKHLSKTTAIFVDPLEILCAGDFCLATVMGNGEIVATALDYGHLTAQGASVVWHQLDL